MTRTRKTPTQLKREVDQWNDRVKVGDRVLYAEVIGDQPKEYVTATAAELLSGHTPVVWLVSKSGCVAISHCSPIMGYAPGAGAAERELTPEAQADRDDFVADYGTDGNCSCHISPPCGSCTHPGNPRNQAEDDSCWQGGAA